MESHYRLARSITKLLDNQFQVLGFKFGLDPILGLVPGIGSAVTTFLSFYLIWIAIQIKVPQEVVLQMVSRILLDFLFGIFPLVGNFADFFYKSNQKNLETLEPYFHPHISQSNHT